MDNYFLVYNESADVAATHVTFGCQSSETNSRSRMNLVMNTWSYKESSWERERNEIQGTSQSNDLKDRIESVRGI
jgi:hypothetical protein